MPTKCISHEQRRKRDHKAERVQRVSGVGGKSLAQQIRDTARWEKVSKSFLDRHPLCADPFGHHKTDGVYTPSRHTHHIQPVETHPDLAFDESNFQAVCHDCHGKLNAIERKSTGLDVTKIVCGMPELMGRGGQNL